MLSYIDVQIILETLKKLNSKIIISYEKMHKLHAEALAPDSTYVSIIDCFQKNNQRCLEAAGNVSEVMFHNFDV